MTLVSLWIDSEVLSMYYVNRLDYLHQYNKREFMNLE